MLIVFNFFALQVSFTVKELREMTKLPGCKAIFNPEDFRIIQEKLSSRLYFQFKFLLKEISGSFLRCYGNVLCDLSEETFRWRFIG